MVFAHTAQAFVKNLVEEPGLVAALAPAAARSSRSRRPDWCLTVEPPERGLSATASTQQSDREQQQR